MTKQRELRKNGRTISKQINKLNSSQEKMDANPQKINQKRKKKEQNRIYNQNRKGTYQRYLSSNFTKAIKKRKNKK